MKILILADANSIHTKRWCYALKQKGIQIALWSLPRSNDKIFVKTIDVFSPGILSSKKNFIKKIKYLFGICHLNQTIKKFNPDIVHAHYMSSYGLMAMFSTSKNYVVSTWGSDIFRFPKKNKFFRFISSKCLNQAVKICSTSEIMGSEIKKYTSKKIEIVPFGVNLIDYREGINKQIAEKVFTIGTIKALENIYGIDTLIKAFNIFHNTHPRIKKKLVIVGNGSLDNELKRLVKRNSLQNHVEFSLAIPHSEVPNKLQSFNLFCALSREESFGVAVIEAQAAGIPVLVSNAPGFQEIVINGITGIIVPKDSPKITAGKMYELYKDKNLRSKLVERARKNVQLKYDWEANVDKMVKIYKSLS